MNDSEIEPKLENVGWTMPEEDRKFVAEGHAYGQEHAAEFVEAHDADIDALIGVYSDSEAEALFWTLRTKFWAQIWKPKKLRERDTESESVERDK